MDSANPHNSNIIDPVPFAPLLRDPSSESEAITKIVGKIQELIQRNDIENGKKSGKELV